MKKYCTGYLASDLEHSSNCPRPPYKGKGWYITFAATEKSKRLSNSLEVVINANSLERAENVLMLFNSANTLYEGFSFVADLDVLEPEDPEEREYVAFETRLIGVFGRSSSISQAPTIAMIAAKASFRKALQYALIKFRQASLLYSRHSVDLDSTNHAYSHFGKTSRLDIHVRLAYSIILSYSVVEEIGLEIRASQKNPSTINGVWNPKVKLDLEERLKRAKVNLDKGVFWHVRGKRTKHQKEKTLNVIEKPSFSKGPYFRDAMIDVCDAIAQASYLRSKVASHKMTDLVKSLTSVKSLTPYDAENVRGLARFLLLSRLGFWPE